MRIKKIFKYFFFLFILFYLLYIYPLLKISSIFAIIPLPITPTPIPTLTSPSIPIPNCKYLTVPDKAFVGKPVDLLATYEDGAGKVTEVGMRIVYDDPAIKMPAPFNPCNFISFDEVKKGGAGTYNFSWKPEKPGKYIAFCRALNDNIAECRGDCVDGPPYTDALPTTSLCKGPGASKIITVEDSPTSIPSPCFAKSKGDANCDGKIDGIDYSMWLNRQCTSGCLAENLKADFNGDNKVNDEDYSIWFNNRE